MSCIPDSLYMFIIGGQSLFDCDIDSDESSEQGIISKVKNVTTSMCSSRFYLQCHWWKESDSQTHRSSM